MRDEEGDEGRVSKDDGRGGSQSARPPVKYRAKLAEQGSYYSTFMHRTSSPSGGVGAPSPPVQLCCSGEDGYYGCATEIQDERDSMGRPSASEGSRAAEIDE